MWQSTWRCRVVDQGCYPVARVRREHPVTSTEPPPRCTDHGEPMILQGYSNTEPQEKPKAEPRFRKGGFKAQQQSLF